MKDSGAKISDCGTYRYTLFRQWDDRDSVVFIMLNPSTADATDNDRTIEKCIKFAKRWGRGGIMVVNLFSFRATKPAVMKKALDPIGPETAATYRKLFDRKAKAPKVICAWGLTGGFGERDRVVLDLLRGYGITPMALKVAKDGYPSHPLYLSDDSLPIEYDGRPTNNR